MYMTSREFNQDLARAKRESLHSPVIITDRGTPKHVLLSFVEFKSYQNKTQPHKNALEMFMNVEHDDVADIELEIPPRSTAQRPPVDFAIEE